MKIAIHKWVVVEDLMITLSTTGTIPESVWTDFMQDLKSKRIKRFLGTSLGSVDVSSVQRKESSEVLTSQKIPAAIITDEKIVRGIVTAISWLGGNIKAFQWTEVRPAIRHLHVPAHLEDVAFETVMKLRSSHRGP